MRRCGWIYLLIGIGFGILDWYYLDLLGSLGRKPGLNDALNQASEIVRLLAVAFMIASNYGIWLVPVIPASIIEWRRSHSLGRAALAAAVLWAGAMVGYYGYYALLLLFTGLPGMEFMLYSSHLAPGYWADFWPSFKNLIIGQFLMWLLIALIAGPVVGWFSAIIYKRLASRREMQKAAV